MTKKTYYYVQGSFGDVYTVLYGHTENQWLACQYAKFLSQNKFLIESYPTKEDALAQITTFQYTGDLNGFYRNISELFDVKITGEDIISTFETGMNYSYSIDIPKQTVVSTCADVLGGTFISYAERFLLPRDILNFGKSIRVLLRSLGFLRGDGVSPEVVNTVIMICIRLQNHRLFREDEPPFFEDGVDDVFDMIRYGIWRGWYTAL